MVILEDITKTIAKQLNLKESVVEECIRSQFQFVVDTMKEGKDSIQIIHIGKFLKKPPRKPMTKYIYQKYIAKTINNYEDYLKLNNEHIRPS